ncbi:MAG: hypothetical protein K8F91_02175 [Candidatus Obscuribacterales bacterium]|nr:hypothetical protein [Candidatus Obscuribacterales bacterium]
MITFRAQWPHTIDDIIKALDGVWGVVGATGTNSNLYRLERSLKEPTIYMFTQYQGDNEANIIEKKTFEAAKKQVAVDAFARAIGFPL